MESVFLTNPYLTIVSVVCIVVNALCAIVKGKGMLFPIVAGALSFFCITLFILCGADRIEIVCMLVILFLIASSSFVNGGKKK